MNPILKYRKKHKVTAREIASKIIKSGLSCDISYIYHLENGRAKPSYQMAKALSKAMDGHFSAVDILESYHRNS